MIYYIVQLCWFECLYCNVALIVISLWLLLIAFYCDLIVDHPYQLLLVIVIYIVFDFFFFNLFVCKPWAFLSVRLQTWKTRQFKENSKCQCCHDQTSVQCHHFLWASFHFTLQMCKSCKTAERFSAEWIVEKHPVQQVYDGVVHVDQWPCHKFVLYYKADVW